MPEKRKTSKTTKGSASQIDETPVRSRRIDEDELLNSLGASGTYVVNGFIESDYNAKLAGTTGLATYDKMRKSDAQVRASLQVCKLPILATEWYIEPAKNEEGEVDEEQQEIADFLEEALFERMEQDWQSYLTEVLTCLDFGFSVFEKVYTADDEDDRIWLKRIASRKQTTIEKWETENGAAGITQTLTSKVNNPESPNFGKSRVSIPASKLLLFSFQKEGDNYAGVSVLRSAYRHWYMKDRLYQFDAVKHERQGVGIPYIKLPKGHTDKDKTEARKILKNIRVNEQGGVILPNPDWEFGFADLQAGNTSDMWKSIDHHNREIVKNVLAQFLELGNTESGSRALSEDQSDFFLLSEEALANLIEEVHNRFLVRELVDLNFTTDAYPKLRHRKLGSVDYATLSSTLSTLGSAGMLTADEDLETWVRQAIDLPPKMPVDETEQEIDPETGEPIEDDGLDDDIDPDPIDDDDPLDSDDSDLLDEEEDEPDEEDPLEAAEFGAKGKPLPEEVKKKIAKTLRDKKIEHEDPKKQRIKKGTQRLVKQESRLKNRLEYQRGSITKRLDKLKADLANAKSKKEKTALRKAAAAELKPLREMRKQDIATRKAVRELLKKRKAELKAKIKSLRDALKQKKIDLDTALDPLRAQIARNREQAKQLRALKKRAKGEAKKALVEAIKGLLDENASMRTEAKSLRAGYKGEKEKTKETIKKEKDDSGLYSEIYSDGAAHILELMRDVEFEKGDLPQGGQFFAEQSYSSWRPLTFAEQKVNWKSLRKSVDRFKSALDAELDDLTSKQKSDLLEQVRKAVDKNDIAAVGQIKARHTGEISAALSNVQKEMFEAGKNAASLEMGVKAPPTAREVMGAMKVTNKKMAEKLSADMENAAADAVAQVVAKKGGQISGTGTAEAVAAADEAIEKVLESKAKINTLTLYGSLNLGRAAIFERYPEKVYGFQYSAIIDNRTTDHCLSLDGRVVKAGSADFYKYSPPQHYECRSIFVEILQDEEFKPDYEDIPKSIKAAKTIDVFEDLKKPVVKAGSPAIGVLKAELAERKKKLAEYEKAGTYLNRQASHKERIEVLKKAIGD